MSTVLSDLPTTMPRMHFHPWRALRNQPDITLRFEHEPGRRGSWCQRTRTIRMDPKQLQREARCTVLHEQVHAARGHDGCQEPAAELSVKREVARRLITIYALVDAVLFYGEHDLTALAEELWVDEETVLTRLLWLHPAERAYLERRLASRDGAT